MKKHHISWKTILAFKLLFCILLPAFLQAQQPECVFKDPLIRFDFGNQSQKTMISLSAIKRYNQMEGGCPDDGNYSFASNTNDCFSGHWHSLFSDHTPGDEEGRMMIVNAAMRPGIFFLLNVAGLKPGSTYEFANWIVNICRSGFECTTIPPLITVSILGNGIIIKSFTTGEIPPVNEPTWKKYSAEFTIPQNVSAITIQMENENPGGCGNDFAIDDISLRECIIPEVVMKPVTPRPVQDETRTPVQAQTVPAARKPAIPTPTAEKTEEEQTIKKTTTNAKPIDPQRKEINKVVTVPKPITTRENPVISKIENEEGELLVELYDNGQIDGDTVSIFHNNVLIKSREALSAKPVSFRIKLDKLQPHHELIMVAENLGSIPPNTSLMIITTTRKRYEVFISSSEQKNAKIVIDLKE